MSKYKFAGWDFFYLIGNAFNAGFITVRKAYIHTAVYGYYKVIVKSAADDVKVTWVIYVGALKYRMQLDAGNALFRKIS